MRPQLRRPMAAEQFAPRGWRAAMAAEQQLRAASPQATIQPRAAAAAAHGAARPVAVRPAAQPQPPAKPALVETPLSWGTRPEPAQQCPAPAAAAAGGVAGVPPPQVWLLVAIAAIAAFATGWLLGRWQLRSSGDSSGRQHAASAAVANPAAAAAVDASTSATSAQTGQPAVEHAATSGPGPMRHQASAAACSGTAAAAGGSAGDAAANQPPTAVSHLSSAAPAGDDGRAPLTPLPHSSSASEVRLQVFIFRHTHLLRRRTWQLVSIWRQQ